MLSSTEEVQKKTGLRRSKSGWFTHIKDKEQTFASFHSALLSLSPLPAAQLLRIHSHHIRYGNGQRIREANAFPALTLRGDKDLPTHSQQMISQVALARN